MGSFLDIFTICCKNSQKEIIKNSIRDEIQTGSLLSQNENNNDKKNVDNKNEKNPSKKESNNKKNISNKELNDKNIISNIQKEMIKDIKIFDEFNEIRKNPDSRKAANYENISDYFEKVEQQNDEDKYNIIDLNWENEIYIKIRQHLLNMKENEKINYDKIFELIYKEKKKPIKKKLCGQCEYKKEVAENEANKKEDKKEVAENDEEAEKKAYKCLENNPDIVLSVLTENYSNLIVVSIPKKNTNLLNIYFFFYDI